MCVQHLSPIDTVAADPETQTPTGEYQPQPHRARNIRRGGLLDVQFGRHERRVRQVVAERRATGLGIAHKADGIQNASVRVGQVETCLRFRIVQSHDDFVEPRSYQRYGGHCWLRGVSRSKAYCSIGTMF